MAEFAPIVYRLEASEIPDGAVSLMTAPECHQEIINTLPFVERRALVKTMAYTSDPASDSLVKEMARCSANTNARVALHVELYSQIQQDMIPLWLLGGEVRKEYETRMQRDTARIKEFTEAGGEFALTGRQSKLKSAFSIFDVDHIKVTILDDTTYIQQNNLVGRDIYRDINFVAKLQSRELADELQFILFDRDSADETRIIDAGELGVIIIDSGREGSLISTEMTEAVAKASDEVEIATVFTPTPSMTRAAQAARDAGANVDYVYGGLNSWKQPGRIVNALGSFARRGLQTREFVDAQGVVLHGNLVLADGTVGLASYVYTSVQDHLRTRDIAFVTQNTEAVTQGRELFRRFFPKEEVL